MNAFVRPGTDDLKKVEARRESGYRMIDEGGSVVAQGEGDLSELHYFELQPDSYRLRIDGAGLRTIIKQGAVVDAGKATRSRRLVVAE